MASICIINGVVVYMYTENASKHHSPHVHIRFAGESASLSIPDGEVIEISEGFDRKKLRNVQTWIDYRKEDLMADWQLACEGKKPLMILPLS